MPSRCIWACCLCYVCGWVAPYDVFGCTSYRATHPITSHRQQTHIYLEVMSNTPKYILAWSLPSSHVYVVAPRNVDGPSNRDGWVATNMGVIPQGMDCPKQWIWVGGPRYFIRACGPHATWLWGCIPHAMYMGVLSKVMSISVTMQRIIMGMLTRCRWVCFPSNVCVLRTVWMLF